MDLPLLDGRTADGSPDPDVAARAARAWLAGGIVGLPTETVYGLAADAQNADAVARVYGAKGRPADHPLIVHVQGVTALAGWSAQPNPSAERLAAAFWPGALTVIVARSERAGDFITGGQGTVALRCPDHPVARACLEELARLSGDPARGVAAPSANRFGRVSPTRATDVIAEVGAALDPARDLVVDGGSCAIGVESTIVDCTATPPRVLRLGAISQEQIDAVLAGAAGGAGGQGAAPQRAGTPAPAGSRGSADMEAAARDGATEPTRDGGGDSAGARPVGAGEGSTSDVRAPGTLESHYSPEAEVVLVEPSHAGAAGLALIVERRAGHPAARDGATEPTRDGGGDSAGARPVGAGEGSTSDVRAPGTLESHYSPEAEVVLVEPSHANPAELESIAAGLPGRPQRDPFGLATLEGPEPARIMGDGPRRAPSIGLVAPSAVDTPDGWTRLAAPVAPEEYARVLYASLRAADAHGLDMVVAVLPDPDGGPLALAVRDRLARAAHGG